MNITELLMNDIRGVADTLVHEVAEQVEFLLGAREDTPDHYVDGYDEQISMELYRLHFDNVKLDIPDLPNKNQAATARAIARELWKEEVNRLLDLYNNDSEYPINFRL